MITYYPKEFVRTVAPLKKVERLISSRLTLNRAVLGMLADNPVMSKRAIEKTALGVLKDYKTRFRAELREGAGRAEAFDLATNDKRLLVARIDNAIAFEASKAIKEKYEGDRYKWLPSDADTPDPLHQLNYGKIFRVGIGEMPGDRYGCSCGMRIITEDDELFFE